MRLNSWCNLPTTKLIKLYQSSSLRALTVYEAVSFLSSKLLLSKLDGVSRFALLSTPVDQTLVGRVTLCWDNLNGKTSQLPT